MCRRLARVVGAGLLLLLGASPIDAQPVVRQVLVLHSFARGNLILDQFAGNFRVDLDQRAGHPVNVVEVVVGPTGFVRAPEAAVVDYIQSIFAGRPRPDLIVTVAGPAAVFARKNRQQLFPGTPLLFAAVDQRYLGSAPLDDTEAAVGVVNDFPRLIDDILQVLPATRQVFVVLGSGPIGRFWRPVLEREFGRFRDRLEFVWSDDLSFADVVRRCASLPANSAIFYLTFGTDAQGSAYADGRILADLHARANAPMFAGQSVFLGAGVVGGSVLSIDDLSRRTADVAIRLLNGARPDSVRVPLQLPGAPTFDWRELQRWGIPESRLPTGSIVRYRRPSFWREYRFTALSALGVLVIQSLLIVGLLYERRARQHAEFESRKNLALAADASRRQTMSALTSSIGHELGQPLTAIMHNADSLQLLVSTDPATSGTINEILCDIHTEVVHAKQIIDRHRAMLRSRQLEMTPTDLHGVINESLALVAHDMRARRIETTVSLPPAPCLISGDPVLLQQVIVNLLVNAMDAVVEMPAAGRRIAIGADVRATDVAIWVRDTGPGLPAQINGKLFAPFVTTKSHGLGIGLTIVRNIVGAHGGTIEAHNNGDGGATVAFTLRRSETPSGAAAQRP
jgi:signal transduction histidine kinase